jgi:hypothetical protein
MKDTGRHSSSASTTTNVQQRRCNSGDDEQRRQRQSSSVVSSMFSSDNMKPTKRRISILFICLGVTIATVLNFCYGLSIKFYNPVVDLYDDFEYMIKVTGVDANLKQQQQQQQSAKKKKKKKVPLKLSYIHESELQKNHMFSDSWLLNRKRFLEINSTQIYKIEDAALIAAWPRGGGRDNMKHPYPHAKMLVDWTDFSVEHLSKVNCSILFPFFFFPYYILLVYIHSSFKTNYLAILLYWLHSFFLLSCMCIQSGGVCCSKLSCRRN